MWDKVVPEAGQAGPSGSNHFVGLRNLIKGSGSWGACSCLDSVGPEVESWNLGGFHRSRRAGQRSLRLWELPLWGADGSVRTIRRGHPKSDPLLLPPVPLAHPQTLQKLEVPIIDSEICSRLYWRGAGQEAITEDMLCAGYLEGQRDACLVSTPPSSHLRPPELHRCPPPQISWDCKPP